MDWKIYSTKLLFTETLILLKGILLFINLNPMLNTAPTNLKTKKRTADHVINK